MGISANRCFDAITATIMRGVLSCLDMLLKLLLFVNCIVEIFSFVEI